MLLTHHNRYYIMFYLYIISVCVLYCIYVGIAYCTTDIIYSLLLKNNNKKEVCAGVMRLRSGLLGEIKIYRFIRSGRRCRVSSINIQYGPLIADS